ncbi:TPA: hypothetical protein QCX06_004370 [Bacillus paranthracis]|uniref:DUF7832 domain-containing protein n=1 Tax=Bacillus paranthracis TaxID=2026186 RepID=UPI0022E1214C|nr:hypothetical protein [Bacillus paranthracis]MED1135748.1 hypothetical protein [Bacillus paranthracis]HDR7273360.1 hypothetical protein [Bacillus paranthracis]HDR7306702.1 hypothetical protein [Bacillus paranthracis]
MLYTIVYDKAKYHYQGDFPEDLPIDQAFVHTGMFLGWILEHNLFSEEFEEESLDEIKQFKLRQMTGTEIYMNWDGVLADDMLNDEGNQFAMYYFNDEEWKYISDYSDVFIDEETLYHVKDTWENYFKLKEVIDNSYNFWKDNLQKR